MAGSRWSSVGSVELLLVEDGHERVPPRFLFSTAPEEELSHALASQTDANGLIAVPINCLLMRSGGSIAAVDAGAGRFAEVLGATTGGLDEALARAGIGRDEVEVVVITHAHPDHIGGLTIGGEPAFPSASHLMGAPERRFWSDPQTARELPELMAEMPTMVEGTLACLERSGLLELIGCETEVLSGVRMVPAPGHTPGHVVVAIESEGARATFVSDAVLHAISFAHPDWAALPDVDPREAVRTRRALLEQAVRDDVLVLATHLEQGGRVRPSDAAFAFQPADPLI